MELHDRCPKCLDGILIFSKDHLVCDICKQTFPTDTIPEEGECDCSFCSGLKEGSWTEMMLEKILIAVKAMSPEDYNEVLCKVRELNEYREEKNTKK